MKASLSSGSGYVLASPENKIVAVSIPAIMSTTLPFLYASSRICVAIPTETDCIVESGGYKPPLFRSSSEVSFDKAYKNCWLLFVTRIQKYLLVQPLRIPHH